jgi:hypothetical protein
MLVEDEPVDDPARVELFNRQTIESSDMLMGGIDRLSVDNNDPYSDQLEHDESESRVSTDVTITHFFTIEGVNAGRPLTSTELEEVDPTEMPQSIPAVDKDDIWLPFASKADWELASWFSRAGISKGKIEEWFRIPEFDMPARNHPKAMKSYSDLVKAVYSIPYGIPNRDEWEQQIVQVEPQIAGGKAEKHKLLFRPIKACLEFLLGHEPFAPDMVWEPVKKSYGQEAPRVYDELNTGTWWWDMQLKIPPGATLVPVILATDKTLMTKLGGDRVVWPVYLQCGNHNRYLRRQQQLPSTILFALLPTSKTVSKSSDDTMAATIRSELYHTCMGHILKG